MSRINVMVNRARVRAYKIHCGIVKHWGQIISLALVAVLIGVGGQLVLGRTQAPLFWIIYGGNTDPGNGAGDGAARQQMIAGGWTDEANSFQVTWKADIASGTNSEVNDAVASGRDAVNKFCGKRHCIYAGFSLGTMPALGLSKAENHAADDTYLFGGPQPSPGIWHNQYQDNPGVQPWVQLFGQMDPNQVVAPGTHNYFDGADPYNNAAPQCSGPGLYGLNLNGHRIITRAEADNSRQWTGTDGVLEFEVVAPPPVSSGADPSPFWAGCEGNDWHNTPFSPGAQVNPDNPVPGGSPIPSQNGNMPSVPSLPGAPTP